MQILDNSRLNQILFGQKYRKVATDDRFNDKKSVRNQDPLRRLAIADPHHQEVDAVFQGLYGYRYPV